MRITVDRRESDADATLSIVYIDGVRECYGLEDEYRSVKVPDETRVPAGEYRVGLRQQGGFHARYKRKFPSWHRGMLHIKKIPGFQYVLIHIGNFETETAGCLLVGRTRSKVGDPLAVWSSGAAYRSLYEKVVASAARGTLSIEFIDNDR